MNLQIFKIEAYSKKEVAEKVAQLALGLDVKYDATRSYNDAQAQESFDLETFAKTKLEKSVKSATGVGFVVALDAGQPETKTRLYEVENITTVGTVRYALKYMLVANETTILGIKPDKGAAIKEAKRIMNDVKSHIKIVKVKFPVLEDNVVTAIVKFDPSETTKLGTYLVFGYTD